MEPLAGKTREELEAMIREIDDHHPPIPPTWQAGRDELNRLGNLVNSAGWLRACLIHAITEPPDEEKPPPWFIPTPRKPAVWHPPRGYEPAVEPGFIIPVDIEECRDLVGILGIFSDYSNWERAAIVHAIAAPERSADRVTFASMANWGIVAAPKRRPPLCAVDRVAQGDRGGQGGAVRAGRAVRAPGYAVAAQGAGTAQEGADRRAAPRQGEVGVGAIQASVAAGQPGQPQHARLRQAPGGACCRPADVPDLLPE